MGKPPSVDDILPAATNFVISAAERIRALDGLPAHLRRLSRIEQLMERLVALSAKLREGRAYVEQIDATVELVNGLIEMHNRYYPIEANLPIDRATGLPRHGEGPFVPLALIDRADYI